MTRQGGWPPTAFGARLRELREQAQLTQKALAERAGCHLRTITKLENGLQEPAWPLVLALCAALGVSCEEFTRQPADRPPVMPGRPRKVDPAEKAPKRPRGRRRKTQEGA
jgi:transcriptional regulator with XRE-family HTH domain